MFTSDGRKEGLQCVSRLKANSPSPLTHPISRPKHLELDVPNLQVIKLCQSLTSKGYVATRFSWQYYYYILTSEGIEYLREYLHLPAEIVPNTHKRQVRAQRPGAPGAGQGGPRGGQGDGSYRAPRGTDQGEYRRRGATEDADKKDQPAPDFRARFVSYPARVDISADGQHNRFTGGVGRGAPAS